MAIALHLLRQKSSLTPPKCGGVRLIHFGILLILLCCLAYKTNVFYHEFPVSRKAHGAAALSVKFRLNHGKHGEKY